MFFSNILKIYLIHDFIYFYFYFLLLNFINFISNQMQSLLFKLLVLLFSMLLTYHLLSTYVFQKEPNVSFISEKSFEDISENPNFLETMTLGSNPVCLKPTKNCQSTNAEITSLAASLTKGKSKYEGAVAIFNWLHANIHYEEPMYYNTKHGALGTLHLKKGK